VTKTGESSVQALPDATELALERTRLAYERTLLAWMRTAIALISFGFTVYKFFQYLHESGQVPPTPRLFGPRQFAMLMIGFGLMALLLATIEHRHNIRSLRKRFGNVPLSLATVFSSLIAILGLIGFVSVVLGE
jgi:putative membrane protein